MGLLQEKKQDNCEGEKKVHSFRKGRPVDAGKKGEGEFRISLVRDIVVNQREKKVFFSLKGEDESQSSLPKPPPALLLNKQDRKDLVERGELPVCQQKRGILENSKQRSRWREGKVLRRKGSRSV